MNIPPEQLHILLEEREGLLRRVAELETEVRRLTTWRVWPAEQPEQEGWYWCAMRMTKHGPPCYGNKQQYGAGHWWATGGTMIDAYVTHFRELPPLPEEER